MTAVGIGIGMLPTNARDPANNDSDDNGAISDDTEPLDDTDADDAEDDADATVPTGTTGAAVVGCTAGALVAGAEDERDSGSSEVADNGNESGGNSAKDGRILTLAPAPVPVPVTELDPGPEPEPGVDHGERVGVENAGTGGRVSAVGKPPDSLLNERGRIAPTNGLL